MTGVFDTELMLNSIFSDVENDDERLWYGVPWGNIHNHNHLLKRPRKIY